ncbi:hypothetical protein D3C80_2196010 [compost metagenome]
MGSPHGRCDCFDMHEFKFGPGYWLINGDELGARWTTHHVFRFECVVAWLKICDAELSALADFGALFG